MRLGVIACEAFKKELELLTEGDGDIVHKEYLEFRLHEFPQELRTAIVDKVNSLQGKVDAVFLGYGICQSLKEVVNDLKVPTVTLAEDDCVGVFLTSQGYEDERKKCTGTFFAIPYFAEQGLGWFESELYKRMPDHEELGVDFRWYMDKLFDGYSRCLTVETGVGDREELERKTDEFAEYLNLRRDYRDGTRGTTDGRPGKGKDASGQPCLKAAPVSLFSSSSSAFMSGGSRRMECLHPGPEGMEKASGRRTGWYLARWAP